VLAVTNVAAPTVAELTAVGNVDLECFITADGLNLSADEGTVDNAVLCDTEDYELPGRSKWNLELTMQRHLDVADDKPYQSIKRGSNGFVVIRYGLPYTTAYAAGQSVMVFTVTAGAQRPLPIEREAVVRYMQKMFVSGPSDDDAAVAA
jgi:hypothetical protein